MTSVRQPAKAATRRAAARSPAKKPAKAATAGGSLAQVRLRADEMATLRETMATLQLASTSEALREGLRLLAREAVEVAAADEIRSFYGGKPAPLPEGVTEPTAEEIAAVENMTW